MFKKKTLTVLLVIVFISKSLQLTVDCEYKTSQRWKVVKDPYSCFITTLDVKSKLFVRNVTGTHLPAKTNNDVKALKIIGGCEIIPSGLGSIFPNIEVLAVWKANLMYVSSTDLQQFRNLREIWLYVNNLEYLESKLFQYNPKVEIINFNGNNIKYVGENFFDYLPNLQKAFFIYNDCINGDAGDASKLIAIKEDIKKSCSVNETLNSLQVTVNCEYKTSSDWKVVENPYGCSLTTLDIKNKLSVVDATGKHVNGKTNSDVTALNIYGGICTLIPSAFDSIFPNIEVISIWNASLKIVSSRDLQQFSNLREFWLYANDVDYLESDLFKYNPKVEAVVFKSNKIKYIGGNFFDYLPNLRIANFLDNDCINDEADDAIQLSAIKDVIKEECPVPGKEPRGYTTIKPDGLTYWMNSTAVDDDGEGFGGINTDGSLDSRIISSLVG